MSFLLTGGFDDVNHNFYLFSFACNTIGPEGAKAIGEALKVNTTLTELK